MTAISKGKIALSGSGDSLWLWLTIGLALAGLVVVFSASSDRSAVIYNGDTMAMVTRQAVALVLGLLFFVIASRIPMKFWHFMAYPSLAISFVMLAILLMLPQDEASKGAVRWLAIGPFSFQPSEVAKYAIVLALARYLSGLKDDSQGATKELFIPLGVAAAVALLIIMQPSFSIAGLIIAVALIMMFIGGVKLLYLVSVVAPLGTVGFLAIRLSKYRWDRFTGFYSSDLDIYGKNYQLIQSFIGFGRGGIGGVGLGDSKQKLKFLPDAHTDFIYTIVGEELGLVGSIILLSLFLLLFYRGFQIAVKAESPFAGMVAAGVTATIGLYASFNMLIATGAIPTTGLPLPLISYGGSSLVTTLAMAGVVYSISRDSKLMKQNSPGRRR